METNKRIEYIDVARGLVILIVVYHHTILVPDIVKAFYAPFFMPFFFFVSGLLYKQKKTKDFIKGKVLSLLVPYLFWRILCSFIDEANRIRVNGFSKDIFADFSNILVKGVLALKSPLLSGPIWFFICLFIANIIYFIIDKITNVIWFKCLIIFLLTALGIALNEIVDFVFPFKLINAIIELPYIFAGAQLNSKLKEKNHIFILKNYFLIILFVVYSASAYLHYQIAGENISVTNNSYHYYPLFYLNAFLGSILLINLANKLSAALGNNSRFREFIISSGKYSAVILCVHGPVTGVFKYIFKKMPFYNNTKYYLAILITLIVYVLTTIFSNLIVKTKLSVLFGIKKQV